MDTTDKTQLQAVAEGDDREEHLLRRATDVGCGRVVREKLTNCSYAEALYLFLQCEELCRKAAELGIREKIQPHIEAGNTKFAAAVVEKVREDRTARQLEDEILRFAQ